MSNTRNIVDFAINDQGKEARDALYAEIHDRVMAKFEEMKLGISQNLIAPYTESVVAEEHDDEKEDKALVKKMVKDKCLKSESFDEEDEEFEGEEEEEEFEDEDEE